MAQPEKLTTEQVINALRETRGLITYAAKRLNVSYNTVRRMIENYPTVKQAFEESKEQVADDIELTSLAMALGKKAEDGKSWQQEPNVTMLIYYMKSHPALRKRGFTESMQHSGDKENPIEVIFKHPEKKRDDSTTD